MEEKKPLNVSDDIKTIIITKLILIKLIENYSFEKVVDTLIKREKEENELFQVVNVIKQKSKMDEITNIIFELKKLYKKPEDKKEEKKENEDNDNKEKNDLITNI